MYNNHHPECLGIACSASRNTFIHQHKQAVEFLSLEELLHRVLCFICVS